MQTTPVTLPLLHFDFYYDMALASACYADVEALSPRKADSIRVARAIASEATTTLPTFVSVGLDPQISNALFISNGANCGRSV
jgi:hypothetical protein